MGAEQIILVLHSPIVVSEYMPRLPWFARNAMQRNRTLCGLSNAVVVIESGLKGGTFEAGKAALALRRPLFVEEYAQPAGTGNCGSGRRQERPSICPASFQT